MKPSALFEALHALIGQRVPLHVWGACGVGKSQIVAQVANDLNWQFLDIRAVQLDPVGAGHPVPRRADLGAADDTGRLLSAGARSQAGRVPASRWMGGDRGRQSRV